MKSPEILFHFQLFRGAGKILAKSDCLLRHICLLCVCDFHRTDFGELLYMSLLNVLHGLPHLRYYLGVPSSRMRSMYKEHKSE